MRAKTTRARTTTARTTTARTRTTVGTVVLAAALTCCTGGSGPPAATGSQDAAGCADRVSRATLVATFPGFDRTVGAFVGEPWSGGQCAVFAADGTRLARVDVTHHTTAAALAAALDDARHGLGAKPGPADLGGTSWYTAKDSTVGVTLGVGEYEILVGIYAKPAKGTPAEAAFALARDVAAYYAGQTPPA